jgi:hypothetical protein
MEEILDITALSNKSALALKHSNWQELENLSKQILELIKINPESLEIDVREVARNYLSSIIGNGNFLFEKDPSGLSQFNNKIVDFQSFLRVSKPSFSKSIRPEIIAIQSIQLFVTSPRSDSANKAAANLRRLGRPQLAVEIMNVELNKSRLNYYSLVVRGSAFVDLRESEKAIMDGELALKHSLKDKRNYALTLLARAYRDKFKKDGLIEDGETALRLALESLGIDRNPYIARVLISIIRALGTSDYDELVDELNSSMIFQFTSPDSLATEISVAIHESSNQDSNAYDIDPWFDGTEELDEEWGLPDSDEVESIEDYFEDYFEEFSESLANPRMPHLEP